MEVFFIFVYGLLVSAVFDSNRSRTCNQTESSIILVEITDSAIRRRRSRVYRRGHTMMEKKYIAVVELR